MADNKTNIFENAVLLEWFNNVSLVTTMPTLGSNLFLALGTGTIPTDTTITSTSALSTVEANYTGYARISLARSGAVWTVSGSVASNAATIQFGACTAGTNTVTWAAICLAGTVGVDNAIIYGGLTTPLSISTGVTPQFADGTISFTEQ